MIENRLAITVEQTESSFERRFAGAETLRFHPHPLTMAFRTRWRLDDGRRGARRPIGLKPVADATLAARRGEMSARTRSLASRATLPVEEIDGKAIAARAEVPCFVTTATGRITAWNDRVSDLLGHSADWIVGSRVNTSLRPKDIFGNPFPLDRVPFLETALRGKPINPFEITLRSATAQTVPVTVSVIVVLDRSSEQHELVFLLRTRARRRRSDELLDALALSPEGRRIRAPAGQVKEITSRQMQVLRLLADGGSPRRVADQLSLSVHTVRNHIQALFRHLGSHSIAETVAKAYKSGII